MAYIDVDNFKYVNDTYGHDTGDTLLVSVAEILRNQLRNTDVTSRLGGDEFALLLPVTSYNIADHVLKKLLDKLLESMAQRAWPVTFSVGAITFSSSEMSSRDMVKAVDDLMYKVKKTGKNDIQHRAWNAINTTMKLKQV